MACDWPCSSTVQGSSEKNGQEESCKGGAGVEKGQLKLIAGVHVYQY